ncbi:MAG: YkgJ family cysteine cluster protein [Deltaproteobacteria bacterium]|nr:YkgJ family cysteine cluster protein [Deltaproteobacteria bacterium]
MTDTKHCKQCGTCCRKGGPALSREDLALIRQGHIRHDQLVTIRQGELGYNPATARLEPVPMELLKIRGQGSGWTCLFFAEAGNACTIYAHRPATCRILQCWQPEALLATIYQNTLRRTDLINPNDPILAEIERHEQACPGKEFTDLLAQADGPENLARLTELVRADLAIRADVAQKTGISLEMEFFLFGRPLFKQLAGSGVECVAENGGIRLLRKLPSPTRGRGAGGEGQ